MLLKYWQKEFSLLKLLFLLKSEKFLDQLKAFALELAKINFIMFKNFIRLFWCSDSRSQLYYFLACLTTSLHKSLVVLYISQLIALLDFLAFPSNWSSLFYMFYITFSRGKKLAFNMLAYYQSIFVEWLSKTSFKNNYLSPLQFFEDHNSCNFNILNCPIFIIDPIYFPYMGCCIIIAWAQRSNISQR